MRNAWLIMAHNEFEVLRLLLSKLDSPDSDFYLHFDRKVKTLPALEPLQHGRLFVLEERIDGRWGDISLVEIELLLMETALKNGPYTHYHVLSGVHLPLWSKEELIRFYDSHPDETILRLWDRNDEEADFKMRRFHYPVRDFKSANRGRRKACQLTWRASLRVQKTLGIRHLRNEVFYKADQWLSLAEPACRYLVDNKKSILKKYKWSFCPDEFFAPTELMAHSETGACFHYPQLLYAEFGVDSPRTFPLEAYEELKKTGCLWARKFTGRKVQ
jgi:hypothetical protein